MRRLERLRERVRAHPVTAVFLLLTAVPGTLAVFSFRQPIPLPDTALSELEVLFRLLVYAPVSAVRSLLFAPLGLDVLFAIPGVEQSLIFLTLMAFYYGLSVAVVRAIRLLRERREPAQ